MTDKDRETFEKCINSLTMQADEFGHYWLDEGNLYLLWGRAYKAATERAKERERELVKLLDTAIFNAKSVIVNMKDMKGGAGFSVKEEAKWLEKAVPVLKQHKLTKGD